MLRRLAFPVIALGTCVALTWDAAPQHVQAGEDIDPLPDTDGDFLPDCVEWAVLTSSTNPDTDGDQTSDFVEVVQRGMPRASGYPLPLDQELRLVVTGPQPGSPTADTWLHLFVRLVEPNTQLTGFSTWLELPAMPGTRINFDFVALGAPIIRERSAGSEGYWLQVSVPMVSASVLQTVLPCSIQVESFVGGRYLRSGVSLFDVQGAITTLVPFGNGTYAAQRIAPTPGGGGGLTNRVCVLDLDEVGTGPGGTIYEVINAFCDDCNEVECAPTCPNSIGWLLTIPGGLGVLGSSN